MLKHRSILLLALALTALLIPVPVHAQEEFKEQPVEYTFNEEITFRSIVHSDVPVENAVIFFEGEHDNHTAVELAAVKEMTDHEFEIKYVYSLEQYRFRAFSKIKYRFEIQLKNGASSKSPDFSFFYADNRFDWDALQEGNFIVHWYQGDFAFAQSVLDVAQEGMARIAMLLSMPNPSVLDIYIYPDPKVMQDALPATSEDWVAGHAEPDLQTAIVTLPPGPDQLLVMRGRIPHELMHIILYQITDQGYRNLPVWFNEGLASIAELYQNPDYQILLDNAVEKDSLLPMASLCKTFPRDASSALLSYAQSESFTQYLYDTYGASGIEKLISDYSSGIDCDNGARSALGVDLAQLERRWWRDSLSKNVVFTVLNQFLPWLILLGAILIAPLIFTIRSLQRRLNKVPALSQK
jgi:hypothetical protein